MTTPTPLEIADRQPLGEESRAVLREIANSGRLYAPMAATMLREDEAVRKIIQEQTNVR
jgi:hypothetical protein